MNRLKNSGMAGASKAVDDDISKGLKGAIRRTEWDTETVADAYRRFKRALGDEVVIFSGSSIHLISQKRKVNDVDVVVRESKLFITEDLKKRLENEGFEIAYFKDNKIYSVIDKRSGIKIEAANSSLTVGGNVITDHRQLCRLLGCPESTDTLMGFPSDLIISNAISILVKTDDGEVMLIKVPDPIHQLGIKYNLLRLRGGVKDIEDMHEIVKYYYGNFDIFAEGGGIERLREIRQYLGVGFEDRIVSLLKEGDYE